MLTMNKVVCLLSIYFSGHKTIVAGITFSVILQLGPLEDTNF